MTDDPETHAALDHVLVLAPYRRDAVYLRQLLSEQDMDVRICPSGADIGDCLAASPGILMATHEALTPVVVAEVAAWLDVQPSWSEMPIIVLLDRSSQIAKVEASLAKSWPRARRLFYQRPVTPVELVSGVQAAMLARLRQRDVRDHLEREVELRRELNHRVKNILASVASIFEMTRRSSPSVDVFADDFKGRLDALSNVHASVFHAQGEAVSVQEIADMTFGPYRQGGADQVTAEGPRVVLGRETATTFALCLHELVTNAIKYGALSSPSGRVSFSWGVEADELWASWRETGGPAVVEPARSGYGTRYLRSALGGLFGRPPTLTYDPQGFHCEARGLLSRVTRNA